MSPLFNLNADYRQVILTDDGVKRWVSEAKFAKVKDLLVPYTGEDLKWHPVDKRRTLVLSSFRIVMLRI